MSRTASVVFALIALQLLTLGCRSAHVNRAPTTVPSTNVQLSQGGRKAESMVQTPARTAAAHGTFQCGDVRCSVGTQSCCRSEDHTTCVPNARPDPPDMPQLLNSQIEACRLPPHAAEVNEIARCGGSPDCSNGELCCNEFLFGGAFALICKPAANAGSSCDYGEVCDTGKPCHDPHTVCVNRVCSKSAAVQCGRTKCDRLTHTCIVSDIGKLECVVNSEIADWQKQGRPIFDVKCLHHADCQVGELCRYAMGSTFCQRADNGMSGVMCDSKVDCPTDFCERIQPRTRLVCTRHSDSWHSLCDCQ